MTTLALRHVRARRRAGLVPLLGALTFALVLASAASAPVGNAAFPGANGKIAFWSTRDGNQEIYVMNADGSGQTRLTNTIASEGDPAWSPDGTKIAFTSDRDGDLEIYVMNADGTGQTRLTTNPASDGGPTWSPDGTEIAFGSDRVQPGNCFLSGNCEIFVMNADGSGVTRCTNNPAFEISPAWSPDGTKIAFDRGNDIWVMNGCGGVETQLTSGGAIEGEPNWAPDGTKIAFVGRAEFSNAEIFVMNADGSNRQRLTNTANFVTDGEPAWSPAGTKIAFTSDRGLLGIPTGIPEIWVMNADGSGVTNLTSDALNEHNPDWQPLCTVTGTEGNDFRAGGAGDDLICGFGGHDALLGLGGNDRIFGHAGSDGIAGGSGNDRIVGGEAPDALSGGLGNDTIHAADGSKDFVSCGPGIDQVTADPTDVLTGCEVVTFG